MRLPAAKDMSTYSESAECCEQGELLALISMKSERISVAPRAGLSLKFQHILSVPEQRQAAVLTRRVHSAEVMRLPRRREAGATIDSEAVCLSLCQRSLLALYVR